MTAPCFLCEAKGDCRHRKVEPPVEATPETLARKVPGRYVRENK